MICEKCGGRVKAVKRFHLWIWCECENCRMGYAVRPNNHDETLKFAYGENYDAVMREYQNRIQELSLEAKI